jgi:hypothetical protein
MTRDEHLVFCKVCVNRAFDPHLGIVCSLTGQHANFNPTCPDFKPQPDAATPSPFSNNPYELNTGAPSKLMFRRPWLLPGSASRIILLTEL